MKFILLSRGIPPSTGGLENSIVHIAKSLIKLNHKVYIICPNANKQFKRYLLDGINIILYPYVIKPLSITFPFNDIYYLKKYLPLLIKEIQPDLIISRWINYSIALSKMKIKMNYIYIPPSAYPYTIKGLLISIKYHNNNFKDYFKYFSWVIAKVFSKYYESNVIKRAMFLIVFSNNVLNQYLSLYPSYNKKIIKILPGIDAKRFKCIDYNIASSFIKNMYKIPEVKKILIYVGRLEPDKNLIDLFYSLYFLKSNKPDLFESIHLLIVGSGSEEEKLQKLAKKFQMDQSISFCGAIFKDLSYYYSAAWFLLHPSKFESFGHVILESFVCSTPVIAYETYLNKVMTASNELIKHGVNGYLVDSKIENDFAKNICKALELSLNERLEMGKKSKDVISNYSWDSFIYNMLEQYSIYA